MMGTLGIVALVILIVIGLVVVGGWLALAITPGRIAKQRGHPQADAISVCGWMGALTLGVLSPLAFVWAYTRPTMAPVDLWPPAPDPHGESEAPSEEADS